MKNIKIIIISCFLCFSWLILFSELAAATRIAIVSEKTSNLSDLLTAELSNETGLALLDRSEIRKIFKEHKISVESIDSKQILSLNKLLKTDLFVVLESELKTKKPIGLVVFDANTGVRYWDSALPEDEVDIVAGFAVNAVKQALGKRQKALGGKLKYISLLSVRNADLPRNKDPFCKAIGILLMRQLGNSANFAVLERNYLDYVTKERNLAIDKSVNQLKTSTLILDLEVSRKGTRSQARSNRGGTIRKKQKKGKRNAQSVKCALFIQNKKRLSVNGILNQPEKLANKLAANFANKLKCDLGRIHPINKQQESKRLFREYLFEKERDKEKAFVKIAAWHALNPETPNQQYLWALLDNTNRINADHNTVNKVIGDMDYALELAKKWFDPKHPWKYMLYDFGNYAKKIAENKNSPDDIKKEAIRLMLREAEFKRKILEKKYGITFNTKIKNFKSYDKYSQLFRDYLVGTPITFKPYWNKIVFLLYKKWLKRGEEYIKHKKSTDKHLLSQNGVEVCEMLLQAIKSYDLLNMHNQNKMQLTLKQQKQIKELFELMLKHPIQPIRITGKCGTLLMVGIGKKNPKDFFLQARREIAEFTKTQIASLGGENSFLLEKGICYDIASNSIGPNLVGKIGHKNVGFYLFDFMYQRKELSKTVASRTLVYLCAPPFKPELWPHKKAYEYIKKIQELCAGNETRILYKDKGSCKSFIEKICNRKLRIIYKYHPDVSPADSLKWKKGLAIKHLMCSPVIKGDLIYAVIEKKGSSYLIKIDPQKATIKNIPGQKIKYYSKRFQNPNIPSADSSSIADGRFLLNGKSGLVVFSIDGSFKPFILDKTSGLASDNIIDAACIEDKLLIAAGQGEFYFYLYDFKDKKLELLSSSSEKKQRTPFSNQRKRILTCGMISDPKNKRILMNIVGFNHRSALTGIWQFDIKTRKFTRVLKLSAETALIKRNNRILISTHALCYQFDIKQNKANLIYGAPKRVSKKIRDAIIYDGMKQCKNYLTPPHLLSNSYFWSGGRGFSIGMSMIRLSDGKTLPIPKMTKYGDTSYLNLMVDEKFLLLGEQADTSLHIWEKCKQ